MGYETRIHVVSTYPFETDPPCGTELATIDLCKSGIDTAVGKLIAQNTRKAKEGEKPPFSLYPRNPKRQYEAVEILREVSGRLDKKKKKLLGKTSEEINKLSNDIEDGQITTDCYGDFLGVMDIDDFIFALEEDLKSDEKYRRFEWALALLKAIKASWVGREAEICKLKVITYGH